MAGIKGRLYFGPVPTRHAAVQYAREHLQVVRRARLYWRADSRLGSGASSISIWPRPRSAYCDELQGKLAASRTLGHRNPSVSGGPGAGDPSRLRRVLCELSSARASRRRAYGVGGGEVRKCIDASAKLGLRNDARAVGRICLAHDLSLAAAVRRVSSTKPSRNSLAAGGRFSTTRDDHGCVIGLRTPSRLGHLRRRHLRDVPRPHATSIRRVHQLRSEPFPLAAARLLRIHRTVRQTDQRLSRQGRRVPAERPRRRLWRLPAMGQARRTLPLAAATARSTSTRVFSLMTEYRLRWLGSTRMGVLREEPRAGRARGAPFIRQHLIEPTTVAFDDFAGRGSECRSKPRNLGTWPEERTVMESWKRKLRMGMVGGGQGAFIGGVHRIAATLDQQVEVVAGCFSQSYEQHAS